MIDARRCAISLCLSLAALTAADAGTLYKTTTPDGRIVYTDRPPPENKVDQTFSYTEPVREMKPAQAAPSSAAQPKPEAPVASAGQVVLYTTSWCPYCKNAKAYLQARGIALQEIDTETNSGRIAFAAAGGSGGVPLLIKGSRRIQGFSPQSYDRLFSGS